MRTRTEAWQERRHEKLRARQAGARPCEWCFDAPKARKTDAIRHRVNSGGTQDRSSRAEVFLLYRFHLLLIVLLAVTLGTTLQGFVGSRSSRCASATFHSLFQGHANTCFSSAADAGLPIYLDVISLLGAAVSAFILVLYVRLSKLLLHVPLTWTESGEQDPSLHTARDRRLAAGHLNALSNPDLRRLGLFDGNWLPPGGGTRLGPTTRVRFVVLGISAVVAVVAYVVCYEHAAIFQRICTGSTLPHCAAVARDHWWASWDHHPLFAVLWVLAVTLAFALGADNFLTTNAVAGEVKAALGRGSAHAVVELPHPQPPLQTPFIENLPGAMTSWTFLQGFLAELRLGIFPTIGWLLLIITLLTGLGSKNFSVPQGITLGAGLVGMIAFLLTRLLKFQRLISFAARRTLLRKIDEHQQAWRDAKEKQKWDEAAFHSDRTQRVLEHGVLPPVSLDVRLRTIGGYSVAAAGLILTFIQTVSG